MNSIQAPQILLVAHHPISGRWVGGIEVYLANIAKALAQRYGVLILTPKMDSDGLKSQIVDAHGNLVRELSYSSPYTNWQLTSPEREQAFAQILDEFEIDLVHFHHLAGHPPSLIHVAQQKGVPTVFSAHDFFSLCHVANLVNDEGRYCNPATLTAQQCDKCLSNTYAILPGSQLVRRNAWRDLLESCDALVFNTQSSQALIAAIYPEINQHPKQYFAPAPISSIAKMEKQLVQVSPLKVAVMGNFLHHKGADTILSAMKMLKDEPIEFHVFGNVEAPYLEQISPLLNQSVWLHGPYSAEQMPAALWDCQVSLHVSIWPETYCLTLSEATAIGLVPVVTDIGALGERVTQEVNGVKIEVGSVEQLCRALRDFNSSPKKLQQLQHPAFPVPSAQIKEHLAILHGIYDELIESAKKKAQEKTKASLMSNGAFTSINWARFLEQPSPLKRSNHRPISILKSVLRRILR